MQAEHSLCGFRFAAMSLAPRQWRMSAGKNPSGLHFHPAFQGVLATQHVPWLQSLVL
jgi:hypothetical protein